MRLTGGAAATVAATSTGRPTARFDLGGEARTGAHGTATGGDGVDGDGDSRRSGTIY